MRGRVGLRFIATIGRGVFFGVGPKIVRKLKKETRLETHS